MSEDLKLKYEKLQKKKSDLNNMVVALETEVKNLKSDIEEAVTELLEKVGKSSYEEAVGHYKDLKQQLEEKHKKLSEELDEYINQEDPDNGDDLVGSDSNIDSSIIDDFDV